MTDERLNSLLNRALDEALVAHVVKLFAIWMTDDSGQPARAATGCRKAIKAWRDACNTIDAME